MKELDDITGEIIDAAIKVHKGSGRGCLSPCMKACLSRLLIRRGLKIERQKPISFEFDGIQFDDSFRVDLLVDDARVSDGPLPPLAGARACAA